MLENMSNGLRGHDSNRQNSSAGMIVQVKEVIGSLVSRLAVVQKHYRDGDSGEAAAALKATVDDFDSVLETSKKNKENAGLENYPATLMKESDLAHITDIPDSLLGGQLEPQMIDKLIDFSR